jgi:hypothetical protein
MILTVETILRLPEVALVDDDDDSDSFSYALLGNRCIRLESTIQADGAEGSPNVLNIICYRMDLPPLSTNLA